MKTHKIDHKKDGCHPTGLRFQRYACLISASFPSQLQKKKVAEIGSFKKQSRFFLIIMNWQLCNLYNKMLCLF